MQSCRLQCKEMLTTTRAMQPGCYSPVLRTTMLSMSGDSCTLRCSSAAYCCIALGKICDAAEACIVMRVPQIS